MSCLRRYIIPDIAHEQTWKSHQLVLILGDLHMFFLISSAHDAITPCGSAHLSECTASETALLMCLSHGVLVKYLGSCHSYGNPDGVLASICPDSILENLLGNEFMDGGFSISFFLSLTFSLLSLFLHCYFSIFLTSYVKSFLVDHIQKNVGLFLCCRSPFCIHADSVVTFSCPPNLLCLYS